jgi:hypothetical protein
VAEEADDVAGEVVVGKPSPSRRGGGRWSRPRHTGAGRMGPKEPARHSGVPRAALREPSATRKDQILALGEPSAAGKEPGLTLPGATLRRLRPMFGWKRPGVGARRAGRRWKRVGVGTGESGGWVFLSSANGISDARQGSIRTTRSFGSIPEGHPVGVVWTACEMSPQPSVGFRPGADVESPTKTDRSTRVR